MKYRMLKASVINETFLPEGSDWKESVRFVREELIRYINADDHWLTISSVTVENPKNEV